MSVSSNPITIVAPVQISPSVTPPRPQMAGNDSIAAPSMTQTTGYFDPPSFPIRAPAPVIQMAGNDSIAIRPPVIQMAGNDSIAPTVITTTQDVMLPGLGESREIQIPQIYDRTSSEEETKRLPIITTAPSIVTEIKPDTGPKVDLPTYSVGETNYYDIDEILKSKDLINAYDKIKPGFSEIAQYIDKDGKINVGAAINDDVPFELLNRFNVSEEVYKQNQNYLGTLKNRIELGKYLNPDERTYDINKALKEGVSLTELKEAGFTDEAITKAVNYEKLSGYLNEEGKLSLLKAREAIVDNSLTPEELKGLGIPPESVDKASLPMAVDTFLIEYEKSNPKSEIMKENRGLLRPSDERILRLEEVNWTAGAEKEYNRLYGEGAWLSSSLRAIPYRGIAPPEVAAIFSIGPGTQPLVLLSGIPALRAYVEPQEKGRDVTFGEWVSSGFRVGLATSNLWAPYAAKGVSKAWDWASAPFKSKAVSGVAVPSNWDPIEYSARDWSIGQKITTGQGVPIKGYVEVPIQFKTGGGVGENVINLPKYTPDYTIGAGFGSRTASYTMDPGILNYGYDVTRSGKVILYNIFSGSGKTFTTIGSAGSQGVSAMGTSLVPATSPGVLGGIITPITPQSIGVGSIGVIPSGVSGASLALPSTSLAPGLLSAYTPSSMSLMPSASLDTIVTPYNPPLELPEGQAYRVSDVYMPYQDVTKLEAIYQAPQQGDGGIGAELDLTTPPSGVGDVLNEPTYLLGGDINIYDDLSSSAIEEMDAYSQIIATEPLEAPEYISSNRLTFGGGEYATIGIQQATMGATAPARTPIRRSPLPQVAPRPRPILPVIPKRRRYIPTPVTIPRRRYNPPMVPEKPIPEEEPLTPEEPSPYIEPLIPLIPEVEPDKIPVPDKRPGIKPDEFPTVRPDTTPYKSPETYPEVQPMVWPTVKPDTSPTIAPDRYPVTEPKRYPIRYPEVNPKQRPMTEPAISPMRYPEINPTEFPLTHPAALPLRGVPGTFPNVVPNVIWTAPYADDKTSISVVTPDYTYAPPVKSPDYVSYPPDNISPGFTGIVPDIDVPPDDFTPTPIPPDPPYTPDPYRPRYDGGITYKPPIVPFIPFFPNIGDAAGVPGASHGGGRSAVAKMLGIQPGTYSETPGFVTGKQMSQFWRYISVGDVEPGELIVKERRMVGRPQKYRFPSAGVARAASPQRKGVVGATPSSQLSRVKKGLSGFLK